MNQPCCSQCFHEKFPGVEPVHMVDEFEENNVAQCCFCGEITIDGIYVQAQADQVHYPTITEW